MNLAIISHTPHYCSGNKISGWGPTVREINHLAEIFDEIYHIAPLHKEDPPESSDSYNIGKINFIPIKPYGGESFKDKFSIITTAFYNFRKIRSVLDKVDWVQFRAPTAMGIYVLPYLSLISKPRRWVKYAGNWKMENPPLSYRFQKWWLENNFQRSKVTINGRWTDQRSHILDFQNPCLDNNEIEKAREFALKKDFNGRLTVCFAGTLTKNKGVDIFLDALEKLKAKENIEEVLIAGDGNDRAALEKKATSINLKITFKGLLSKEELGKVYEASHLIVLPSESEGFPKVIAEAAAYGCIPVVSNVSSIGQYFNDSNGFLLHQISSDELSAKLDQAFDDRDPLKIRSLNCLKVAVLFTFENYNKNLMEKIILA